MPYGEIWGWVSSTDIETGIVVLSKSDNAEYVVYKSDSLYLISDSGSYKVFGW